MAAEQIMGFFQSQKEYGPKTGIKKQKNKQNAQFLARISCEQLKYDHLML